MPRNVARWQRVRAWWQSEVVNPMQTLSSSERAAAMCLGIQTGLFPVPGCTMVCLGICIAVFGQMLPCLRRIPRKVLTPISCAINLLLAPVQLLAIPLYAWIAEVSGVTRLVDWVVDPVTGVAWDSEQSSEAASAGSRSSYVTCLYLLRSGGAGCLVWAFSTILFFPIGFLLTYVIGGSPFIITRSFPAAAMACDGAPSEAPERTPIHTGCASPRVSPAPVCSKQS